MVLGVVLVMGSGGFLKAQEGAMVVITEVQWDGVEYIKMESMGGEAVDLTGWSLKRQRREGEGAVELVVFEKVVLEPGTSLIVGREGAVELVDVVVPSLVLHNDGNLLELVDQTGMVVDTVGHLGPWFAGKNTETGVPMTRIDWEAAGDEARNWRDKGGSEARVAPEGGNESGEGEEVEMEGLGVEEVRAVVTISEVLPNPVGADAEGEFIELFNGGEEAIDITGWQLDDMEGGSKAYRIAEGVLAGGEYTVWSRPETGLALNNEGDSVRLLSPEGEIAMEMVYGKEAKAGWSWNWREGAYVISERPTPGVSNVIVQPQPSPAQRTASKDTGEDTAVEEEDWDFSMEIVIFSFLPNPVGADGEGEYIELENQAEKTVRLAGWQLDDVEGGSKPYGFEEGVVLAAGERRKFLRSETKLALNNGGDMVRVIDPAGTVVAVAEYDAAGEGEVFSLNEDGEYIIASEAGVVLGVDEQVMTVAQARLVEEDTVVTLEGVVVAPPGVLGSRVMYVADEDGVGLQVYWSRPFPELGWGDKVRLTGVMGRAYGERRLRLGEVTPEVVGKSEVIRPTEVATGEIGEDWEGYLVQIEGLVTEASGSTLYADDGSGEVRVVVKAEANIKKPRMRKGMRATVVGVVSETQSGYRILPRRQEDFVVGGAVAGEQENNTSSIHSLLDTNTVLSAAVDNVSLPSLELPSQSPIEQDNWTMGAGSHARQQATRNTIVLVGLGLAAVQLVGGAREGEPLWKRKH